MGTHLAQSYVDALVPHPPGQLHILIVQDLGGPGLNVDLYASTLEMPEPLRAVGRGKGGGEVGRGEVGGEVSRVRLNARRAECGWVVLREKISLVASKGRLVRTDLAFVMHDAPENVMSHHG